MSEAEVESSKASASESAASSGSQGDDNALVFEGVHKEFRLGLRFKRVHAVRGVSLEVKRGEIFGYLGPNGAGKTTSMKMALGLIRPTQGTIRVLGEPVWSPHARERVGYAPEQPYFYDFLTPVELLAFYGKLYRMPKATIAKRTEELLATVGLEDSRNQRLRGFSKGMLQRAGIAQALLASPELVILDEPLSGLDPLGRKELRDVIVGLRAAGTTVFLSSHILHDIEMVCDRVAILIKGQVERIGVLEELLRSDASNVDVEVRGVDSDLREQLEKEFAVVDLGRALQLKVPESGVSGVLSRLLEAGAQVSQVAPRRLSLEELFMKEAGRE